MTDKTGDGGLAELRRRGAAVRVSLVDGQVVLTGEAPQRDRQARVSGEADALETMVRELWAALGMAPREGTAGGGGEGTWAR